MTQTNVLQADRAIQTMCTRAMMGPAMMVTLLLHTRSPRRRILGDL